MVMRDLCNIVSKETVTDEYMGEQIKYKKLNSFYANVRIVFSNNEDGLTNRQGLHHLEGHLVTQKDLTNIQYISYDNHIFQIILKNPQAKLKLYKLREVRYKDGQF